MTQTPSPTPTPRATPQPSAPTADAALDEDEVIRVTSNLVVVPVAVTDAGGQPVEGLTLADFRLEEEGRAQELTNVGDADQVPLDIAILFDVSSSVSEEYKFQQEAAARFLKQVLKPGDRAAVFAIAREPQLVQKLAPSETAASKILAIPAATEATPTAFYDTVKSASKYLAENAPERNRRVILVISDGEDNFSTMVRQAEMDAYVADKEGKSLPADRRRRQQELHRKAVQELLREVQRADVVFYSINPTGPSLRLNEISTRAQENMKQLADTTGGNSFVPANSGSLDLIFRQIAAELRAQYLLQYLSSNEAVPGKYLRIKVQTPQRPGLNVRSRQGYYKK